MMKAYEQYEKNLNNAVSPKSYQVKSFLDWVDLSICLIS